MEKSGFSAPASKRRVSMEGISRSWAPDYLRARRSSRRFSGKLTLCGSEWCSGGTNPVMLESREREEF
jgi:hypothetical protein